MMHPVYAYIITAYVTRSFIPGSRDEWMHRFLKEMEYFFVYTIVKSSFFILRIFRTPHFPHCALRIFHPTARAWRNIGKYVTVNPNRKVSLAMFSFFIYFWDKKLFISFVGWLLIFSGISELPKWNHYHLKKLTKLSSGQWWFVLVGDLVLRWQREHFVKCTYWNKLLPLIKCLDQRGPLVTPMVQRPRETEKRDPGTAEGKRGSVISRSISEKFKW